VWALNVVVAALAALFYVTSVRHLHAFAGRALSIDWPVLAILFALSEVMVVHLHFRSEAHSISVSELPLVLGLFFATPSGLVLAQVAGALIALVLVRRQKPAKLAFNLANLSLQCVIALIVFHWLLGAAHSPDSALGWGAAIAATATSSGVGIAAIVAAIVISQRQIPARTVRTFAMGLAATFTTTNLGVVAAVAVSDGRYLGGPLLIMAAVLVLAYRAYGGERARRDSLEFLYQASQVTQGTGDLDEILVSLLDHVREMFRAEAAELVMFGGEEDGATLRTTVGLTATPEVMVDTESALTRVATEQAAASQASIVSALQADLGEDRYQLGNLMVARLADDDRLLGALVAASPADSVSAFTKDQLRLFETLANHVTVTLVNGKLERSIAQLRELQRQLSHKAFHDPLTGLANRALFRARLQDSLDAQREGVAVLFIDLDDFKTINDTLGHAAGDRLLSVVGGRIDQCARAGDVAARLGGDEFALLLHDVAAYGDGASAVASRILTSLRVPIVVDGHRISTQASVGIALVDHSGDAEQFMKNADIAMYSAKRCGKGRYEFFSREMSAEVVSRHKLKEDLQAAVARREFENHYQAIVDIATGQVSGVESLVRWHHPRAGLINPSHFIALAEETGAIVPIGRQVLESACRDGAAWRRKHPDVTVSVNISARQLLDESFVSDIQHALVTSGLPPEALTIEITESMTVGDISEVVERLRAAKALGIHVALDDFGTGYSSLSQIRRLPIDTLKIPKPFIDQIGNGQDDGEGLAVVHAITRLGETLGLRVVAEGIEKVEQYEKLKDLPLSGGQGFLFCRPVRAEVMSELLDAGPVPAPVLHLQVMGAQRAAAPCPRSNGRYGGHTDDLEGAVAVAR